MSQPAVKQVPSMISPRRVNRSYVRYIKPCIDYVLGSLILLITLPVFLTIAVLIKLDSRGPVLFTQSRVGKGGKEFSIYKFRTMYSDVPKQGRSPVSSDDPRITRVGRFLRRTSLDELPQIINVLKGDMSLVGPRPEQKMIVDKYYKNNIIMQQRFLVKPGITGLWQLSADRTRPIHENLEYDLQYIRGISFSLDMKIMMKTIRVMIRSNTF